MDSAWIAVIGTLSGVAVTAISGLLSVWLTARHQRINTDRQLHEESSKRLREERRESFINYLSAYQDLYLRILIIVDSRIRDIEARVGTDEEKPSQTVEQLASEESARFSRAYHALTITAGPRTLDAAHDATKTLWEFAEAATRATDAATFEAVKQRARPPRQRLRAFMREELDIS